MPIESVFLGEEGDGIVLKEGNSVEHTTHIHRDKGGSNAMGSGSCNTKKGVSAQSWDTKKKGTRWRELERVVSDVNGGLAWCLWRWSALFS